MCVMQDILRFSLNFTFVLDKTQKHTVYRMEFSLKLYFRFYKQKFSNLFYRKIEILSSLKLSGFHAVFFIKNWTFSIEC